MAKEYKYKGVVLIEAPEIKGCKECYFFKESIDCFDARKLFGIVGRCSLNNIVYIKKPKP